MYYVCRCPKKPFQNSSQVDTKVPSGARPTFGSRNGNENECWMSGRLTNNTQSLDLHQIQAVDLLQGQHRHTAQPPPLPLPADVSCGVMSRGPGCRLIASQGREPLVLCSSQSPLSASTNLVSHASSRSSQAHQARDQDPDGDTHTHTESTVRERYVPRGRQSRRPAEPEWSFSSWSPGGMLGMSTESRRA